MLVPIIQAAGQGPDPEGNFARNSIFPYLKLRRPWDLIRAEVQELPDFTACKIRLPFSTRRLALSVV
jgi:hypothetical protein